MNLKASALVYWLLYLEVLCFSAAEVVGYYTISASSISLTSFPEKVQKKVAYEVLPPVAFIGRLAIDKQFEGKGFGSVLVYDAIERVKIVP